MQSRGRSAVWRDRWVRVLLDTHIALWAIVDDARLSANARRTIGDPANEILVSAASIWEIAIKRALARGAPSDMPISAVQALGYFRQAGYSLLNITAEHAAAVESLPPRHSDPFDRILIAQALTEPLHLLTHDRIVAGYGGTIVEV